MNIIKSEKLIDVLDDFIIIDVREEDFIGGNIVNAINIPYSNFNINSLNKIIENRDKKFIVVHCMYCSLRGPGSYYKINKFLKENNKSEKLYLLKDGFYNFINFCIKNNNLEYIENYNSEYWILDKKNYCHKSEIFTNQ